MMFMKNEVTKEKARQILKKGILDISVASLIQMSHFGLMGNIVLLNETFSIENVFNCIFMRKKVMLSHFQ